MNNKIRQLFEKHTVPSFGPFDGNIVYNERGEYLNPAIEDHWQTFQEAVEVAVKECVSVCNQIYFERYPEAESFERSEEGDAIKQHFGVK